MGSIRSRLSYANVIATIALFGVLAGGGAYAASKIGPNEIANNAVRAKHIKSGAVTAPKIRSRAVTPPKIRKPAIWARVGVSGGEATILAQSGGIKLISGETIGLQQFDVGRNVNRGSLVTTALSTGGAVRTTEGAICTHTAACDGAAEDDPRSIRVLSASTSTGAPLVSPTPYYFAIFAR